MRLTVLYLQDRQTALNNGTAPEAVQLAQAKVNSNHRCWFELLGR